MLPYTGESGIKIGSDVAVTATTVFYLCAALDDAVATKSTTDKVEKTSWLHKELKTR